MFTLKRRIYRTKLRGYSREKNNVILQNERKAFKCITKRGNGTPTLLADYK